MGWPLIECFTLADLDDEGEDDDDDRRHEHRSVILVLRDNRRVVPERLASRSRSTSDTGMMILQSNRMTTRSNASARLTELVEEVNKSLYCCREKLDVIATLPIVLNIASHLARLAVATVFARRRPHRTHAVVRHYLD